MGYEILYCTGCQAQLRGPEFDAGTAFRHGGMAYCEKCAPESVKAAARKPETASVRPNPPTTRLQSRASDTGRTTRLRRSRPNKAPALIAAAGAVILIGGIVVVLAGSGKSTPASPPPEKPAPLATADIPPPPDSKPRAAEAPREEEARRELERLLGLGGGRDEQRTRLQEFVARYAGTFAAASARAKIKETEPPPPPPKTPTTLIGSDLAGWTTVTGTPKIEAGELRLKDNDELMMKLMHPDFELTGSIRMNLPKGNAGIAFRRPSHNRGEGSRLTLYGDGDVHYWAGTDRAGRAKSGTFKMREWQQFRLTARKTAVVLEVAGRRVLEVESPFTEPGYLAFYGNHTGPDGLTAFKDLRLGP